MLRIVRAVADFIYPPRCSVCGDWGDFPAGICDLCRFGIAKIEHPICTTCGKPFESAPNDHVCGTCITDEPSFTMLRSAVRYGDSVRQIIFRFKFHGVTTLAAPLAELALGVFDSEYSAANIDVIVPVPLHIKRLRWRGYNQSLLLARHIAKVKNMTVDTDSLKRIRATTPQAELSPTQRTENVRGAFSVERPSFIDARNILLMDDIATTCSTLNECAKVLKKAGAANVFCLTVARAG